MDGTRQDQQLARTQGLRRVGRITGWTAAGSAAAVLVTAGVLAAGTSTASASAVQPAPSTSGGGYSPAPTTSPGTSSSTGVTGGVTGAPSTRSLQPPKSAPRVSRSRSHVSSGSS